MKQKLLNKKINYSGFFEKKNKDKLTKDDHKYFSLKEIKHHLDNDLVELLIFKLQNKKNVHLFQILKLSNFYIFEWALTAKNSRIIDFLIENLSSRYFLVLLSRDGFAAIKKFTKMAMENSWNKGTHEIFRAILDASYVWEIINVIEPCLTETSPDAKMDLESIFHLNNLMSRAKYNLEIKMHDHYNFKLQMNK